VPFKKSYPVLLIAPKIMTIFDDKWWFSVISSDILIGMKDEQKKIGHR
jgi:hypothetical protein